MLRLTIQLPLQPMRHEKTISVSIIEDSLDEDEESFSVSLTGASQGAVQEAESVAIVSIEDNDDAPSIQYFC